ncbi:MAG: hypothetical protein CL484_04435 [Acidobacteria bacterium]|nr:hypothetical protein [Acidobacteriota bacterium]|tara:strand:+ start:1014 stop:1808 length:795 start_codon:yes stop_codon:yes gene_type:complete
MSLTKDALQHIEASHKTGTEAADGHALIVGEGFKLVDMEKYQDSRRRFRGQFKTKGLRDFISYVSARQADAPVFIDRDAMAACSYLDIGDKASPGHCDHSASLNLPKTPEFSAYLNADGSTFGQEDMVELVEDWGHLLTFENSKGEALERGKVIHAFRKVSLDDLTSIESDKQEHSSRVGVMNSVTVKNADRLPTVIYWKLNPYEGLTERTLAMRVSSKTKGGPSFGLRAIALDAAKEEIAAEFAKLVTDGLPESECLLGTFQP